MQQEDQKIFPHTFTFSKCKFEGIIIKVKNGNILKSYFRFYVK